MARPRTAAMMVRYCILEDVGDGLKDWWFDEWMIELRVKIGC